MIVVILKGGLGNQMFQYALGVALSQKHNVSLTLDTTFLNDRTPRPNFTLRRYELGTFNAEPNFTLFSRLSFLLPVPLLWLGLSQVTARALSLVGIRPYVRQVGDGFDPSILNRGGNLTLDGYFQSERYFEACSDLIQKELSFRGEVTPEFEAAAGRMENGESLCLHVRRGDYVKNPVVTETMGVLGADYYTRAFGALREKTDISHVYVFSDDTEWCRANLSFGSIPVTYEGELPARTGPEAFRLMTHAKNFIIGNSSYSWWAAWLGTKGKNGGFVVAPQTWSLSGGSARSEILPERWIRV